MNKRKLKDTSESKKSVKSVTTQSAVPANSNVRGSRSSSNIYDVDDIYHNEWRSQIAEWTTDENVRRAIWRVQPACVFVDSTEELGSGVCFRSTGLILTAGHAAGEIGDERQVEFPYGARFIAHCVAVSDDYDLALLQLELKSDSVLPVAEIAVTPVKKGQAVYVIGQPGDEGRSPRQRTSAGTVLRTATSLAPQLDMGGLHHNCWTYAGHSGSPVLNSEGHVTGIHVTADLFEGAAVTLEAVHVFIAEYDQAISISHSS